MIINKSELNAILSAQYATPHDLLGLHLCKGGVVARAYLRNAKSCSLVELSTKKEYSMESLDASGFFEVFLPKKRKVFKYMFKIEDYSAEIRQVYDAYSFLPTLSEQDLYLFGQGKEYKIYEKLGSHVRTIDGVSGVSFAVWAPMARRVSVVADFNEWDGRYHQMRQLGASGIWEIFIPHISANAKYKYEIVGAQSQTPFLKTDPYAIRFEAPPYNSAIVSDISAYKWEDSAWLKKRKNTNLHESAMSVYEVHLGSWRRNHEDGYRPLTYVEIGQELSKYCKEMNFTHVEFLPLTEFPFDGSWGYQVTGFYAPTHRFGSPQDFMKMVDIFHQNDIGVIMDWVPAHFPRDVFALAQFDGSCLYEHEDPRQGAQEDWGTLCFNYGRNEVRNFLIGSALSWFERFHIDGIRVDAVAAMLYLDYSRKNGQWVANKYGGNENLDAIEFLKELNTIAHLYHPGVATIAEESTIFANVSRPVKEGGLGFDFKWNMGWMHDTLAYFKEDPLNRKYHHDTLTLAASYQFTENFVSVYSHDEVVHGKGSMVNKMGSGYWDDKLATLRALYAYMWMWPGKKTLFMGSEFGQSREWRYDGDLDWQLLKHIQHSGIKDVVRDAAKIYLEDKLLAKNDHNYQGFSWINYQDGQNSVISFERFTYDGNTCYTVVCNFTPVMRKDYELGLSRGGVWEEVLNTDASIYGGGGRGNLGKVEAVKKSVDSRNYSMKIMLPALTTLVFKSQKL